MDDKKEDIINTKVLGKKGNLVMKFNILYLHETSILGGAENSLLNLVSKLDKNKFQPFFICPQDGPFVDELKKLNIEVFFVRFPRLKRLNPFRICSAINKIRQVIRKKEIALVHSSGTGTNLLAAVSAKLSHVLITWHARNLLGKGMWDIDRFFSFLPDKIICNSEAIRERFYKRGKIQDKIITIINGVNVSKFDPGISGRQIRKEFDINDEEIIVGMVGRLDPSKGHEYFLHAAAGVVKSYPRVRFLIVGDTFSPEHFWLREHLRNLVQKLHLEKRVIFAGFRRDMPQVLAGMDIFVLASDAEPCGRVLFEAMAMAKPIVATNTGGTPEIVIDRETGLLVPPRNSEALAKNIIILLNNRELAKEMGQRGRERVEKYFTIQEHVEKTEAVYEELLIKKVNQ